MGTFVLTTVSSGRILAQTPAATQKAAESTTKAQTTQSAKPSTSTAIPKFEVKPDFGNLKGGQVGAQTGINLLAAILIAILVIAFIGGLISIIVGKVADMPHWSTRGKAAVIGAPVIALLGSMAGEVVGWGWTLGG